MLGELVTGIKAHDLVNVSRSELLDSALNAPQAGFEEDDFYPDFFMKAAVLCSRLALNHPLPDGNKRLAWICLVKFCDLNGFELSVPTVEAVDAILLVASGQFPEPELADWIRERATRR